MDALNSFKNMSGLAPSLQKSTAFFCNVPATVKASILEIMPFEEGQLPVRYLGVPLISSRLLFKDCRILIEKMEKRITDWRNKSLSFAGRLQLINSVLSSLHVYWSSIFILPTRLIKDLEKRMRGFLWCQGPMKGGKTKVAWKDVCVPKYEGGLGIKRIADTNKALMTSHIWSILSNRNSLWVAWIRDYKLKGRSFWSIPIKGNCTWGWRKLLLLRQCVRRFIRVKLGNGRNTSAWFDSWCDVGPLENVVQPRDIKNAGFSIDSTVADIHHNGNWIWPSAWRDLFPVLINIPNISFNMHTKDELVWKVDSVEVQFSSSVAWHSLRCSEPEVPWVNVVWFSQCVPRHAFNMWLIMRGRLLTQDKILQWPPARRKSMDVMCCPLCFADFDSHPHLFFECVFSSQVWFSIRDHAYMSQVPPKWTLVSDWLISHAKLKSLKHVVSRLLVAASAYYIWQERNQRIFTNQTRPPDVLTG